MSYKVKFPSRSREKEFDKQLSKMPDNIKNKILDVFEELAENPRPYGNPKIRPPISVGQDVASYRMRVGNHRILYDVDDTKKTVWILALRLRSEKTYK